MVAAPLSAPALSAEHAGRQDLVDRVELALLATRQVAGRNVRFEVAHDAIVLTGVVRSYFHKQVAQEALRNVVGTRRLSNKIQVARD